MSKKGDPLKNLNFDYGLTELGYACIQNDFVLVKELLKSGTRVNVADQRNSYPIHYAVRNGNADIIKLLINHASQVDVLNSNGESPLHFAVRSNHIEIIRLLVEKGCDVNISQPDTYVSPLIVAVASCASADQFEEILKLLLLGRCRLDGLYPASLYTPLYMAICLNKADIAAILLRHGASPNVDCPQGLTVLQKACYKGLRDLALLLRWCDIEWSRERWLDVDIYHSGIDTRLFTVCYDNVPIALLRDVNLYHAIQDFRHNPVTLAHACRRVLRRHMKCPLFDSISHLQVPQSVQNYLMLYDVF